MKKLFTPFILWYIRMLAKIQLLKTKPLIVGVAGSSGKSSLSQLIATVLQTKYNVDSSKEKNSETGIPLHILNIHMKQFSYFAWLQVIFLAPFKIIFYWPKIDIFVAEMGIDSPVEPKNMSYLLKIIQPTIGVVTNISLEHSVYFEPYVDEIDPEKKQEQILQLTAEQETMLLLSLPEDGHAIVNLDDEKIRERQKSITAEQWTISLEKDADLVGKDIQNTLTHFAMTIVFQGKESSLTISQPLPKHFAYEFLLAIGVGLALDLSMEDCIDSLQKHFSLPPGRLSFFTGIKNTTIIDSTYNNATLPPVLDILDFLKEIAGKRRKIAIIGDMRELGEESEYHHVELAKKLIETVDFAILIGPQLEKYAVPLLTKANVPFENFPHVTSATGAIQKTIHEGDIILVKGSQNTLFLERVVEMLLAEKKDIAKLTRRGEFWDKKRSETP